jgi:integrase
MNARVTRQSRRGKRVWVVDWIDAAGNRHQPQYPTKEAADDAAHRINAELRAQHGRMPELPVNITWTGLFDRVMAERGDLKPRTLECYRETHTRYLQPAFGATAVRNLTRTRLKEFLRGQLRKYSRNTTRIMAATIHVVLAEAAEDGLIPANPAAGLARKLKLSTQAKARQEAVKVKAMTREERDLFLDTAARIEPFWAPAWHLQVLTGLRPGELLALEERDVNLHGATPTLRVERTLSVDGRRIDTPKGGFGRAVDLSNEACRVFRAHLTRRREETLQRGWRELPRPLFCSTTGTYADPSGMREAFRRVCVAAKLTAPHPTKLDKRGKPVPAARFSPHGLRHTFAALHLQAGTDVYYVSRMLGHADISLTVSTYGAWLQPTRRAGIDALDRTPSERADEDQA